MAIKRRFPAPAFCFGPLLWLVIALFWPAPGRALSPADAAAVVKAEDYLNSIQTLKAHFIQIAPDGGNVNGTVYLSRPGRLRLDYDPPSPILLIANGGWLIYHDKQLEQTSYLDLDSSPAGVLVRAAVKLNEGDLEVTSIGHVPGMVDIEVIKRGEPGQGRITLSFSEAPFQLRQWQVMDSSGQVTTVSLSDAHKGVAIDDALFQFHDPREGGDADSGR
ncbi:MAG TPA: outer membrane lipoprotein carrier protein LolA [Rhodospirillaceae bacterium]|nr:outer membrane lipoprotein carrier protein LolA [Rhodospirillaceae bacterium]